MSRKFLTLMGILAVAVMLVSGCTQQETEPSLGPSPGPSEGNGEITGNVGLGLDLSDTEDAVSDLDLSDLDTLGSDLDDVIGALE